MKKIFDKINKPFDEEYLTPTWKELKWRLEALFSGGIPENFLEIPLIQRIMTATDAPYIKQEKEYLKDNFVSWWDDTTVHHQYHIHRYSNYHASKHDCMFWMYYDKVIIEWGGGYGNMAYLIKEFFAKRGTYIIIDIPIMIYLQFHYFISGDIKHFVGYKNLNVINNDNLKIKKGKINLLSLPFLETMELDCDLFISTWALSESGKKSIDYIIGNNFFNARHILMGLETTRTDQFPYSQKLIDVLKPTCQMINIDIISPYQFYLFR